MAFILITGRDLDQGLTKDKKSSKEYLQGTAICKLSPQDMLKLGIREGDRVKITTAHGWVVVRALSNPQLSQGYVFMPLGIWASFLMGSDTASTGMPQLKGIPAQIERSSQEITSIQELIRRASRSGSP